VPFVKPKVLHTQSPCWLGFSKGKQLKTALSYRRAGPVTVHLRKQMGDLRSNSRARKLTDASLNSLPSLNRGEVGGEKDAREASVLLEEAVPLTATLRRLSSKIKKIFLILVSGPVVTWFFSKILLILENPRPGPRNLRASRWPCIAAHCSFGGIVLPTTILEEWRGASDERHAGMEHMRRRRCLNVRST
jgi:hypothetical protein